jgi:hypothetical protein
MESFSPDHATENIIQTLIDLPEFLRKPILESRVKEFFSLGIQDKLKSVKADALFLQKTGKMFH